MKSGHIVKADRINKAVITMNPRYEISKIIHDYLDNIICEYQLTDFPFEEIGIFLIGTQPSSTDDVFWLNVTLVWL